MPPKRNKQSAATFSIAASAANTLFKLVIGLMTGSMAVLAEVLHSVTDLLASVMLWFSVRIADTPADDSHQYGHGKVENVTAVIEGIVILAAGGYVVYQSALRFFAPAPIKEIWLAVGVMTFSAIINLIVSRYLIRESDRLNSIALKTNAYHLFSDVLSSIGVALGLVLIPLSGVLFGQQWLWLDAAVGAIIGAYIVHLGASMIVKALRPLVDAPLPDEDIKKVEAIIASFSDKVEGYHCLRSRTAGSDRFVDFHLEVSPEMDVAEAHSIAVKIRVEIEKALPRTSALINTEAAPRSATAPKEVLAAASKAASEIREAVNVLSVRGHRVGNRYRLSIVAAVAEDMPLARANVIAMAIRKKLAKRLPLHPSSEIILEGRKESPKAVGMEEIIESKREELGRCISFHKLRFFYDGNRPILHTHIVMPRMLFLDEVHDHCTEIEDELLKQLPADTEIITHPEPCNGDCAVCVNEDLRERRKRGNKEKG